MPVQPYFHFVFCLDESGSMAGKPWSDLCIAFRQFLEKRIADQTENDLVTVIQFDNAKRTVHTRVALSRNIQLASQSQGGTYFVPPLQKTLNHMLSNRRQHEIPVLVFMSDGEAHDAANVLPSVRNLVNQVQNVEMHTVGFGSGAGHGLLQVRTHATSTSIHLFVLRQWLMKAMDSITLPWMASS